jgi:hypothetical protein
MRSKAHQVNCQEGSSASNFLREELKYLGPLIRRHLDQFHTLDFAGTPHSPRPATRAFLTQLEPSNPATRYRSPRKVITATGVVRGLPELRPAIVNRCWAEGPIPHRSRNRLIGLTYLSQPGARRSTAPLVRRTLSSITAESQRSRHN